MSVVRTEKRRRGHFVPGHECLTADDACLVERGAVSNPETLWTRRSSGVAAWHVRFSEVQTCD
jgi:hypothetical protein